MVSLESWEVGEFYLAALDVHFSVFGAALQGWNRFVRIQQEGGVEGALYAKECFAFQRRKLHAHRIDFFDSYAMFAGDGAADFYTQLQNLGPEKFCLVEFPRQIGVEQNQ